MGSAVIRSCPRSGWHSGQARTVVAWQGREQAWLPQGSGRPQGAPQQNSVAELQGSWAMLWRP